MPAASTPPAPPGVPDAPMLVSPFNASTQPQPITFDWNDAASAVSYTIQIDDSSAFTAPLVREQSVTTSIYATSDLSTATHFWRVRGVNSAGVAGAWSAVRSFTPQTAPPPSQLSTIDLNPASVVGGDASSGTVVMTTSATGGAVISLSSSNPAVASVPATTTVPANGFTGNVRRQHIRGRHDHLGHDHGDLQRRDENGHVDGHTAGRRTNACRASMVSPSSVAGGSNTSGLRDAVGWRTAGWGDRVAVEQQPSCRQRAGQRDRRLRQTAVGFTVTTTSVSTNTSVTITATYAGISRTATATVTATAPPPTPPPPAECHADGVGLRSQWRTHRLDADRHQRERGQQRNGLVPHGTSVTLRVSSGRDAVWSGACSSGGNKTKSCTFTVNANARSAPT